MRRCSYCKTEQLPMGELLSFQPTKNKQHTGTWKIIDAAVDSGAVDVVANPAEFPGCKVNPKTESNRDDIWICAGGEPIGKLGKMAIEFAT